MPFLGATFVRRAEQGTLLLLLSTTKTVYVMVVLVTAAQTQRGSLTSATKGHFDACRREAMWPFSIPLPYFLLPYLLQLLRQTYHRRLYIRDWLIGSPLRMSFMRSPCCIFSRWSLVVALLDGNLHYVYLGRRTYIHRGRRGRLASAREGGYLHQSRGYLSLAPGASSCGRC